MKRIIETLSWLSLVLLVGAPVLFYAGRITLETNKLLMLIATIAWFATTLCWMGHEKKTAEE